MCYVKHEFEFEFVSESRPNADAAAAYVIIILFLSKAALHIGVALTEYWPGSDLVLKGEKDCADRLGDKD